MLKSECIMHFVELYTVFLGVIVKYHADHDSANYSPLFYMFIKKWPFWSAVFYPAKLSKGSDWLERSRLSEIATLFLDM